MADSDHMQPSCFSQLMQLRRSSNPSHGWRAMDTVALLLAIANGPSPKRTICSMAICAARGSMLAAAAGQDEGFFQAFNSCGSEQLPTPFILP